MSLIKQKFTFILILLLVITLTLSMGAISAASNSSENTQTQSYSTNTTFTSSSYSSNSIQSEGTGTLKEIKVLIYNGVYSIGSCVTGIKTGLDTANANNLVPGYYFTYGTATVINSATLAGYNVLAMPGGSDGDYYVYSSSISSTAIRNFVSSGNGYLGICAGAYSGVKTVVSSYHGNYNGWGVAPHVMATRPWVEGDVPIKIETAGQELFGYGGIITMAHYNGPAMYASGGCMVTFATYADNSCNSQGLGAIVGDYYGSGRSVIVGPHPELDPEYPDILGNLVVWAANQSYIIIDPSSSATIAQIGSAAAGVKSYFEANKVLPGSVTVNGNQISMAQFLYLLAGGVVNVNSGSYAAVSFRSVDAAASPSGSIKAGSIYKSEFVSMAQSILSSISANGKAPNYVSSSLGNMSFDNAVYMYSKILNYYKTNGRLPNYVSMTASSSGTTPNPTPSTVTMSQVGSAAATVKSYYESNSKVLPGSVTLASQSVSMPSLLYLLTTATVQANSGSAVAITLKTVNAATSPSGSIKSGSIYKSEFVSIAQSILSSISANGKAPNYVSSSLGNMSFTNLVYMYSKIVNFYKTNNRLPNYVSM